MWQGHVLSLSDGPLFQRRGAYSEGAAIPKKGGAEDALPLPLHEPEHFVR